MDKVTINMGAPSFKPQDIPANCSEEIIDKKVNIDGKQYSITTMLMGVPHTIVFGKLKIMMYWKEELLKNMAFFQKVVM